MNLRIITINIILFFIFYLLLDLIFSRFLFKASVDHKCYEHNDNGRFYKMRENCYSNMRLISSIDSFEVYTDKNGLRYSGKKKNSKKNNIIFLGDSQTFGVGSDWQNTFVGILEKKFLKYNFYNLAVPSYSPTVYEYSLNNFLVKEKMNINKIFVLIDLTDVADEATRWILSNNKPALRNERIFYKESTGFSKFKKENFKGIYLISSKIRSLFRKIKRDNIVNNQSYRPVDGNPTGSYIYTDHEILTGCNTAEKKTNWWKCGDVKIGLDKVEEKIINIGNKAMQLNSEFYIIIMPWPDTLNFGQTKFNWEKFANNLCMKSQCNGLINMFPKFKNFKKMNENWLEEIYLNNDIHLTKKGNEILANEIMDKGF